MLLIEAFRVLASRPPPQKLDVERRMRRPDASGSSLRCRYTFRLLFLVTHTLPATVPSSPPSNPHPPTAWQMQLTPISGYSWSHTSPRAVYISNNHNMWTRPETCASPMNAWSMQVPNITHIDAPLISFAESHYDLLRSTSLSLAHMLFLGSAYNTLGIQTSISNTTCT